MEMYSSLDDVIQGRIFKLRIIVEYDKLYCVNENELFCVIRSSFVFIFRSRHFSPNGINQILSHKYLINYASFKQNIHQV